MPSPLQDLYKSVNDLPILNYPSDLGSAKTGHYIAFSVLVPMKSNYIGSSVTSPVSVIPPSNISSSAASAMNSVGNIATQAASAASSVSSVASSIADTVSSAASAVSGAVNSVAGVANQALGTVNSVVGAATSVVGSVAGVAGIAASASGVTSGVNSVLGGVTAATVGISAATNIVAGLGGTVDSVGQFLTNASDTISNTYDSIKNYLNGPDKLATDAGEFKTYALEDDSAKFSEFIFTPAKAKLEGFINLYMPDTVNMDQHASYADLSVTEALGTVGMGKELLAQGKNYNSIYDAVSNAVGSSTGIEQTLRTVASSMPAAGLELGGDAAKSTGLVGKGFTQYLLGQNNYAKNPQMEVLFTSMDFRTFQFDFTFTPKSPEEANTVREIIKMFRYHAAPGVDDSGSGRYFIVPSVFNIEYRYLEQRNENLHKFAPCALTTVRVDYAPEVGWVAHNDGMPVKTRLTLQFKEMEILTKKQIQEGY